MRTVGGGPVPPNSQENIRTPHANTLYFQKWLHCCIRLLIAFSQTQGLSRHVCKEIPGPCYNYLPGTAICLSY